MAESVFDDFVEDYEDACARGVSLSGETRDYFAQQRIHYTAQICARSSIRRVLDFGCGLGHSTPYLTSAFPDATIVGVDTSTNAIRAAQQRYGNGNVSFGTSISLADAAAFDVAYSNGTFHHIDPKDRLAVVQEIFNSLRAGAVFALWENNPWNVGTRLVMSRIPFDRDAIMLSHLESAALLRQAGFQVNRVSFHFYFPSWLKPLRAYESALTRVPLGAQYCALGRKPQ